MTPELAAKIEASRCKLTVGEPVHLTREMLVELLEQKARVADTLQWLRRALSADDTNECRVRAREAWNRLCPRYYDKNALDPDEEVEI